MQRIIKMSREALVKFNSREENNRHPDAPSLNCLPDEILLKIMKDVKPAPAELKVISRVNKRLKDMSEDESLESDPKNINYCIRLLFHRLYRIGIKSGRGFFGQFHQDKDFIHEIDLLKSKIISIVKADNFKQVDKLMLDTFKMDAIEAFRSSYYSKIGCKLPFIAYSANIYNMYTDSAENKQKESMKFVFEYSKLVEKNDTTIRVRLLLCLYAELDRIKANENRNDYREVLEDACDRIINTMDKDQLPESEDKVKEGIKLSNGQGLDKLKAAFLALEDKISQKLESLSKKTME